MESQTEILVLTNFTSGYFQLFTTMLKLLVILFIIKMYVRNNIFKLINLLFP